MDCDYPGKNAFQKKNKKTLSYMNGKDSDVFGNCSRFIFCLFYIFIFFPKSIMAIHVTSRCLIFYIDQLLHSLASHAVRHAVSGAGTRDERLRTSAWEASSCQFPSCFGGWLVTPFFNFEKIEFYFV